jgi:hypothetical protein
MRGVLEGWLCWLPLADMFGAIGTDIAWFWATEGGLGGLAATAEPDCCMGTLPTMGDDIFCGVPCLPTGEEAAWAICAWKRA